MMSQQNHRHTPEQAIRKSRDIEVVLANGQPLEFAQKEQEISGPWYHRRWQKHGFVTSDEARRLKPLEQENAQLKAIIAVPVSLKTV